MSAAFFFFFFFVVNQSLGHHLESEKEQNAPNLSLKLFTAPHSARCVMGRGGGGGGEEGESSLQIFHISSLVPVSEAQPALSSASLSHFGTVS